MKNSFILFTVTILLVFVILSSCTRRQNESLLPELIYAESIMYQRPDSALIILEEMPMPVASNRLQHATWCLLLTQAKYKNYIDVPNDSLLNIAYHYFMEEDDSHRKALVLYLEGALNEEWQEAEKATLFYLYAIKEVEKTKDYQLANLIYVGLGNIYIYRQLYQYAEEAFLKGLNYARLSGNDTYVSNSLSMIARVYSSLADWDKAIGYYKEAIEIAQKINNARVLGLACSELSAVYTYLGDYLLALEYIQRAIDLKTTANIEIEEGLLTKGKLYYLVGKNDSAYYYLRKALLVDNIYTKYRSYQALYNLSKEEKKHLQALEYVDKVQFYSDSIQSIDRSRSLIEMQEKYNQEKIINERNQLKIEKSQTFRNFLVALIVLIIVIAIIIFIYQRKLIRKQQAIQQHKEEIKRYILKVYENESQISRNENRINELVVEMDQNKDVQELLEEQQTAIAEIQHQNEILNRENKELQENILHYSTSLKEKRQELDALKMLSEENKYLRSREKFLSSHLVEYIKELEALKKKPKYLNATQWVEVVKTVNWLFDNFAERLAKEYPELTEEDVQLCCLIKLGISVSNIGIIVGILSTSVSKRKLRLKERLGESFEGGQTLDIWIQNY